MRLWLDRLGQPVIELAGAKLGDGVALAVGASPGLGARADHLAIPGQPAERRVHLPEWQRLAPAKVGVVVALEVITVARLAFKQAQEGQGNSHEREHTPEVDTERIHAGDAPSPNATCVRATRSQPNLNGARTGWSCAIGNRAPGHRLHQASRCGGRRMRQYAEQPAGPIDLLGIGIGPFNMSLAAMADQVPGLRTAFFERQCEFRWHPGLMIEGTMLQVPFLADLVSLVDPQSRWSFLSYLQASDRLFPFYFAERFHLHRAEYEAYCRWVSRSLPHCLFGREVESVNWDDDRQAL